MKKGLFHIQEIKSPKSGKLLSFNSDSQNDKVLKELANDLIVINQRLIITLLLF